ncbi:MAG: hypothetical protein JO121_24505 [Deltaproteobacteria bacterium]|nr:hypothetical protein [Deltaproteobacteria bacterium]
MAVNLDAEARLAGLIEAMAANSDTQALPSFSWGEKLAAGALAGILAAILMTGSLMAYSEAIGAGVWMPLKTLAALVYGVEALLAGSLAISTGAGIQLGFSIALGILFGLAVSRRTSVVLALFAGLAIGIAIWAAMELYVLPFWDPTMAARIALMPVAYFVAHVLFGIGLGITPLLVRALSRGRVGETPRMERSVKPLRS